MRELWIVLWILLFLADLEVAISDAGKELRLCPLSAESFVITEIAVQGHASREVRKALSEPTVAVLSLLRIVGSPISIDAVSQKLMVFVLELLSTRVAASGKLHRSERIRTIDL